MNLVLIRHSKSLVNPNIPITTWGLTTEGIALAEKLNGISQIKSLEVLYSSLQTKALETAVLATKNTGIPIKTDSRLTESTSFTNKFLSSEELEQNARNYYSDRYLGFNKGESFEQSASRFNLAIEDIAKLEAGKKTIGIVSHGNILTAVYLADKGGYETCRSDDILILCKLTLKNIFYTSYAGNYPLQF